MAKKKKKTPASDNVVAQARKGERWTGPQGPWWQIWWERFKSLAGAVAIYLVIRTLLMEAFRIPSPSMVPSLLVGDWLFVNKLAYGPHIPFTSSRLPGYTNPKRGDIVVFESPYQADEAMLGKDPTPTLVKRLVAMPGDTIYMRDGLLFINGEPQRQGYTNALKIDGAANDPLMDWQHRIELNGTRFGAPPKVPTLDHWGPLLVPQGTFWMMGDNRHQSKDSRFWGVVPRANVRGRPMFVYYSFVGGGQSDRFWPAITDIRWGRIGHWIK